MIAALVLQNLSLDGRWWPLSLARDVNARLSARARTHDRRSRNCRRRWTLSSIFCRLGMARYLAAKVAWLTRSRRTRFGRLDWTLEGRPRRSFPSRSPGGGGGGRT